MGHIRRESGASERFKTVKDGADRDGGAGPPTTSVMVDDQPNASGFRVIRWVHRRTNLIK